MAVAGHTFTYGRCTCGALWADVRWADETCVGKPGWAHATDPAQASASTLTTEQLREIQALKAAEDERFMEVTAAVSGGRK